MMMTSESSLGSEGEYVVLVEVRFPEPVPGDGQSGFGGKVAGYFISVGVRAHDAAAVEEIAREVARTPDEATGWAPPPGCSIRVEKVKPARAPSGAACDERGVFFRSGRSFYPPKRWWQFWV